MCGTWHPTSDRSNRRIRTMSKCDTITWAPMILGLLAGSSPVPPTPTKSTKQAAEASINRKLRKPFYSATVDRRSSLSFADFSKTYDCIK